MCCTLAEEIAWSKHFGSRSTCRQCKHGQWKPGAESTAAGMVCFASKRESLNIIHWFL